MNYSLSRSRLRGDEKGESPDRGVRRVAVSQCRRGTENFRGYWPSPPDWQPVKTHLGTFSGIPSELEINFASIFAVRFDRHPLCRKHWSKTCGSASRMLRSEGLHSYRRIRSKTRQAGSSPPRSARCPWRPPGTSFGHEGIAAPLRLRRPSCETLHPILRVAGGREDQPLTASWKLDASSSARRRMQALTRILFASRVRPCPRFAGVGNFDLDERVLLRGFIPVV